MGNRKYPTPQKRQELFCHRYHLAAELVEKGYFHRMYDANDEQNAVTQPVLPRL